jgi:hypothetical protein
MNVVHLSIGFDSGIHYNNPQDLGLEAKPESTKDGGLVRGLGTHFSSAEDKNRFTRLTKEANDLREQFRRRFVVSNIDSLYIEPTKGSAKTFVSQMDIDPQLRVIVQELSVEGTMEEETLRAWEGKIKTQFQRMPLGRGKDIDETGLHALEELSRCPVLASTTGDAIRIMVQQLRVGSLTRVDFKRNIETLELKFDDAPLQPRRPVAEPAA